MPHLPLRIGTRASPLAMVQAHFVRGWLSKILNLGDGDLETALPIHAFTTTGDQRLSERLSDLGGKGLFTKELDEALLNNSVDLCVHSMKDLPADMPPGLALADCPARGDVRDAFVSNLVDRFDALPHGARLGAASVRRRAAALRARGDLSVELLRGNVQTRLRRIDEGAFDGTFLALAGLKRLGLEARAAQILDPELWLPAPGQGALAITLRQDAHALQDLIAAHAPREAALSSRIERALMRALGGSCRTPIGAYTRFEEDGGARVIAEAIHPDGGKSWRVEGRSADPAAFAELGFSLGARLRSMAREAFEE